MALITNIGASRATSCSSFRGETNGSWPLSLTTLDRAPSGGHSRAGKTNRRLHGALSLEHDRQTGWRAVAWPVQMPARDGGSLHCAAEAEAPQANGWPTGAATPRLGRWSARAAIPRASDVRPRCGDPRERMAGERQVRQLPSRTDVWPWQHVSLPL